MTALFKIAQELQELNAEIEEQGGEIDENLERRLDASRLSFEQKVAQIGRWILHLENENTTREAWITTWQRQREAADNLMERLRRYLVREMLIAEVREVKDPEGLGRWTLRDTPGKTVAGDVEELPEEFLILTAKPDLKKIREVLDQGLPVGDARIERETRIYWKKK